MKAIYFPPTSNQSFGTYLMDRSGALSNENTPEDQYMTFATDEEATEFLSQHPEWIRAEIAEI